MKRIMLILVASLLLAGCYEHHEDTPTSSVPSATDLCSPYVKTAKYKITVYGSYDSWNGGEKWIYFCDSCSYDGTEHYILKDSAGTVLMDFTKRPSDRVEIQPNDGEF